MTTKKDDTIGAPADRVLVLTRVFNAPRHLVFEAWTKKEHYDKWSCPRGFTMHESHADFRPGGEFGFVMMGPDGGKYAYTGIYREFVPDELLVMTHGWLEDDGTRPHETIVTVRFTDAVDGRTKVALEHGVFRSVESRGLHQGGWSECFDKLEDLLTEQASN